MKKILTTFFISACIALCAHGADDKKSEAKKYSEISINVDKNYLLVPMSSNATQYRDFKLTDPSGTVVHGVYRGLLGALTGDWLAEIDVSKLKGGTVKFVYESDGGLPPSITQSDTLPARNFAKDTGRPAFHFTPKYGWLNDPNGLVYFKGKWHLFHQYNPFSLNWQAPMYWGHAVSKDLLHWDYLPTAVSPKFDTKGNADQAFSGTAYFDAKNRSNLFGVDGGVIFAYTSTGRGECLMYSSDMVNFKELPNNPIIKAAGRDPRIFFNEDSGKWTIIRYEEEFKDGKRTRQFFAIYISDDLKKWEKTDELDGYYECPEMFKISVTGADLPAKWVIWEANGNYVVGDFDGRKFTKLSKRPLRLFYGDAYATQVWNNDPKDRILATAWLRQDSGILRSIGQTFSQTMTLPWELRLVRMRDGEFQLRALVPEEVKAHMSNRPQNAIGGRDMGFNSNVFEMPDARGNKYVIEGVADISEAQAFRFEVGTSNLRYIPDTNMFHIARVHDVRISQEAQANPIKKHFTWRAFVDTYSVEIQVNDGEAIICMGDAYLNPDQPIRVGGIGRVTLNFMFKIPMMPITIAERGEIAKKRLEKLLKPAEQQNQPAPAVEKK